MTVGFIGFGEAASCIAEGLLGEGLKKIVAFDILSRDTEKGALVRERAGRLGVELLGSEEDVVFTADLIFAAVPSTCTVDICRQAVASFHPGQLYVDVSASTPKAKQEIWEMLKDTGVLFVDAAMLGALGVLRHKVPILACGNGAETFQKAMAPYGMNITCLAGQAGDASAIKLMRSIYTKGIAAVMIEMLQAAHVYGVEDAVLSSLSKSLDGVPFASLVNRYVEGAVIHARRRAGELNGSLQMLEEAGVEAGVTRAAVEKYYRIAESGAFEGAALESRLNLQEILRRLNEEA